MTTLEEREGGMAVPREVLFGGKVKEDWILKRCPWYDAY